MFSLIGNIVRVMKVFPCYKECSCNKVGKNYLQYCRSNSFIVDYGVSEPISDK
jgi:hypothetical protein